MHSARLFAAILLLAGLLCGTGVSGAAAAPTYYLALGDSLAVGYQQGHETDRGYADAVATSLRRTDPGLRLVKLGCPGETAVSLVGTSVCRGRYPHDSQLDAAVAFLTAHRGQVRYLSLDIGADDVLPCVTPAAVDLGCAARALAGVIAGTATALARLQAADPAVRATGVSYFDPALALGLTGGQRAARESVLLGGALDVAQAGLYARYGFRVADVSTAFHTDDTSGSVTVQGRSGQSTATSYICTYTRACEPGHDIHPNDAGYGLIARTVLRELTG